MGSFLGGRSDRWEYWTSVGLLTAAGLLLPMLHVRAAVAALAVMWIVTWARRLHDIDMSAWVTLAPVGTLIALVVGGLVFGGHEFTNALVDSQHHGAMPMTAFGMYTMTGVVLASLLVQYGFSIWLGVKAGDRGENRFGPPPGTQAVKLEKIEK
jgi:uncharacterized membrane protein YhaH (DUF805 family)